jgi:hypothetical protein
MPSLPSNFEIGTTIGDYQIGFRDRARREGKGIQGQKIIVREIAEPRDPSRLMATTTQSRS